jgi:hypothetical protein
LILASPVIFLLCCHAGLAGPGLEKKLIEFGWDIPSPAFLRQNIARMEQVPFDGVVLSARYRLPDGKEGTLDWECFGAEKLDGKLFDPAIADLRATRFRRFTDNFLR